MIILNYAISAAALVFYLPGVCTHTDTEGEQRKARVQNILKSSEKTQYLMNTLYIWSVVISSVKLTNEVLGLRNLLAVVFGVQSRLALHRTLLRGVQSISSLSCYRGIQSSSPDRVCPALTRCLPAHLGFVH